MGYEFQNLDKEKLTAEFYSYDYGDVTVFWTDVDGVVKPTEVNFTHEVLNEGAAISIQVVSNGFMVKAGKTAKVCQGRYELEGIIRQLTYKKVEENKSWDWLMKDMFSSPEEWKEKFDNYEDVSFEFNTIYHGTKEEA